MFIDASHHVCVCVCVCVFVHSTHRVRHVATCLAQSITSGSCGIQRNIQHRMKYSRTWCLVGQSLVNQILNITQYKLKIKTQNCADTWVTIISNEKAQDLRCLWDYMCWNVWNKPLLNQLPRSRKRWHFHWFAKKMFITILAKFQSKRRTLYKPTLNFAL